MLDVKFSVINGIESESNVLDGNSLQLDAGMMKPVVRIRDGLIQNRVATELIDNNDDKATVLKASFKTPEIPLEVGFSWYRGSWNKAGDKNLNNARTASELACAMG